MQHAHAPTARASKYTVSSAVGIVGSAGSALTRQRLGLSDRVGGVSGEGVCKFDWLAG